MALSEWSTTASSNGSGITGMSWAENMNPNAVNDGARAIMADVRTWYEDGGWTNFGDTCTYASATSFTVSGDVTGTYQVNRRIRAVGSTTGTIYGTITASSYSSPNTTVTVQWAGSGLANETLTISLSFMAATGWPGVALGHPSAVKAYVRFSPTAGTIIGSYNVTGISSSATGVWTITFDRDMGNTNYAVFGMAGNFSGTTAHYDVQMFGTSSVTTSQVTVSVGSISGGSNWLPNSSGDYVAILVLGDF